MTPRLTIAIPTVNRAKLLPQAIESALAQTNSDIEIIVSDNGSTDDTPAVIERYAARDSIRQIRTFRHASTMSAAKHGQFLIEQAQGQFFVGLSDDDFLEPEFATEVLALYDRHPELSFVYTGCAVHYEDRQVPALVGPSVESRCVLPGCALLRQARGELVCLRNARAGSVGTWAAARGSHYRRHVFLDEAGVPRIGGLRAPRIVPLCSLAAAERQHLSRDAARRLGARIALIGRRGD